MLSLPGLNLPGLTAPTTETLSTPTSAVTREQDLPANTEYRFEVAFSRTLTVRLRSGTAEYFGTELAPSTTYSFQGTKGAIYTWHGCKLELGGEVESDYVAEETPMMSHANLHFALEMMRDKSVASNSEEMGPRVLVVGGENAGKTALVKTLTSYAVKSGRQPMVINLDPRQGMLSVPGSFSAAAFSSIVDIEEGWGSSPISGPSPIPVKMPLVYHYGLKDPEEGKLFKPLVTRMALAVLSRMEKDAASKQAGFIIDTAGSISGGRGGVYDNIEHIVSEFSGACDVMSYTVFPIPHYSCMHLITSTVSNHPNPNLSKQPHVIDTSPRRIKLTPPSKHPHNPRLRASLFRPHKTLLLPHRRARHRPPHRQIRRLRRPPRDLHESTPPRADSRVLLRPRRGRAGAQ
jgi:hypothetical protein